MNIGLDFDGTVTEDPDLWMQFVKMMRAGGHSVYIVTMRYPSEINSDPEIMKFTGVVNDIIGTSRQAKQPHCEKLGITINIWIDDNPRAMNESAEQIWGHSTAEGEVHIPTYSD